MTGIAAGLALADACAVKRYAPREIYVQESTLEDVKSGKASPESYLSQEFRTFPELAEAQKSGILKGFMYEPSEDELKTKLHELFYERAKDEMTLKRLIEIVMGEYAIFEKESGIVSIFPGIIHVFGKEVPHYIACKEEFFDVPVINNDEDVRGLLGKHELKHVKDYYSGITLSDLHLSIDTITAETFRREFLASLMEVRASYEILEDTFQEQVEKKKISISKELFDIEATNYLNHWKFLEQNAQTDLEKRASDLQLEELKKIVPKKKEGGFPLIYNYKEK